MCSKGKLLRVELDSRSRLLLSNVIDKWIRIHRSKAERLENKYKKREAEYRVSEPDLVPLSEALTVDLILAAEEVSTMPPTKLEINEEVSQRVNANRRVHRESYTEDGPTTDMT